MPLVKTSTIGFAQSNGEKEFKIRIHCDGSGKFTIKLPTDTHTALGKDSVSATTLAGAETAFHAALAAYKAAQSTTRKVIYYDLRITAYMMDDARERCILSRDDISFSTGASIGLFAGVYEETTITKADSSRSYEYKRLESSIPDFLSRGRTGDGPSGRMGRPDANLIDWTAEAEDFFHRMGQGMRAMILQLDSAFKSPDTVKQLAHNGTKTLLTGGK